MILAFGAVVLGLSIWDEIVNGDDTYAPRRAKREKDRQQKRGQQ